MVSARWPPHPRNLCANPRWHFPCAASSWALSQPRPRPGREGRCVLCPEAWSFPRLTPSLEAQVWLAELSVTPSLASGVPPLTPSPVLPDGLTVLEGVKVVERSGEL